MSEVKVDNRVVFKTEANIEKFINMYLLGCSAKDIIAEIGFARQTYYKWLDDVEIMKEVDRRRKELYTEGQNFIKAQYKKYLTNIDKMCDDNADKRTCLSANIFMLEKMDGKATNKLEVIDADQSSTIDNAKDLLKKYRQEEEKE